MGHLNLPLERSIWILRAPTERRRHLLQPSGLQSVLCDAAYALSMIHLLLSYADEFLEFKDGSMPPDRVSPSLPAIVRCKVVSVRYEIDPFLHCILELQPDDSQFQLVELMEHHADERLANLITLDSGRSHQISSLEAAERKIVVRYHPSDLPDYLVLFSRFRQSLSRNWQKGQRYPLL